MESYLRAEISASAVAHNLGLLRGLLKPTTKLCAVVKADCYGHGLELLLETICPLCDHLAVATPEEAIAVRDLGCAKGLLAFFTPCAFGSEAAVRDALEELIARDVSLTAVSREEIEVLAAVATRVGKPARVHLKIDTGMGRSGLLPWQAGLLFESMKKHPGMTLEGCYTHFASADEADKAYALEQLARFKQAVTAIAGETPSPRDGLTRHAASSAATIDLPQSHFDMVRPGIAVYGYQPSDAMHRKLPLRPALRLVGRLMQTKTLPAGSSCGYGLTHTFRRDSVVGLVPIGYGDGYLRCLSNRTSVRIAGRDVPICGRVSMDQTIVDLTDAPSARVGDEVEIISNDPSAPHSVENLARLAGTIPYEITCRLGRRVKRILVD